MKIKFSSAQKFSMMTPRVCHNSGSFRTIAKLRFSAYHGTENFLKGLEKWYYLGFKKIYLLDNGR